MTAIYEWESRRGRCEHRSFTVDADFVTMSRETTPPVVQTQEVSDFQEISRLLVKYMNDHDIDSVEVKRVK